MARFVASHSLSFLFMLCAFLSSASCQEQKRRPSRYLIPEGYVGWVQIDFKVEDAPALPIEDNHYLFKIPSSGRLYISSDIEYGWASDDDYYHYSGNTRRRLDDKHDGSSQMIHHVFNGWSGNKFEERTATYQYFFVGTEEDYQRYGNEKDENYQPKVGPVIKPNTVTPEALAEPRRRNQQ